ncbi:MarR family winged helix-turn-helix transcriptional regulator [Chromobacterium sphagni]|uniref:HTH marR-type domain-containing protein n=1 Tax=Chromobacterium sphagni TaxID=1903179 RepID=A0A1S1WWW3_9NEIS|nr:MarR family transcriptional regulator [Chromobacterium sphagni]OHX11692.1 hypothetical protein BI347_18795 [Chromobacterium sphagni]OHX15531.1 hypothetical protein BI344_22040 [Chromobacterium sphagni]
MGHGQLAVLAALKNGEASTQTELARLLQMEQPSMAQTLARLERGQLIRRKQDPANQRAQRAEATNTALESLSQALPAMAEGNAKAMAGFSADEEAAFVSFLQRVYANLCDTP